MLTLPLHRSELRTSTFREKTAIRLAFNRDTTSIGIKLFKNHSTCTIKRVPSLKGDRTAQFFYRFLTQLNIQVQISFLGTRVTFQGHGVRLRPLKKSVLIFRQYN